MIARHLLSSSSHRWTNKIGFTTKSLKGLRQRFAYHCQDERKIGNGDPIFLTAFESSSEFDCEIINRLERYHSKFRKDWFFPFPEVLAVTARLLVEARAGLTPAVHSEQERVSIARRDHANGFLLKTFFSVEFILRSEEERLAEFGGVDAVLDRMERVRPHEDLLLAKLRHVEAKLQHWKTRHAEIEADLGKLRRNSIEMKGKSK